MPENKKRPGEPLEIERLFVALGHGQDGAEGIVGVRDPWIGWIPLVFTRASKVEAVVLASEKQLGRLGETIEIVEYQRTGIVKVVIP